MRKTFESTSPFIILNTEQATFEHVRNKESKQLKIKVLSLSNKNQMELDYQELNPFVCLRET